MPRYKVYLPSGVTHNLRAPSTTEVRRQYPTAIRVKHLYSYAKEDLREATIRRNAAIDAGDAILARVREIPGPGGPSTPTIDAALARAAAALRTKEPQ